MFEGLIKADLQDIKGTDNTKDLLENVQTRFLKKKKNAFLIFKS